MMTSRHAYWFRSGWRRAAEVRGIDGLRGWQYRPMSDLEERIVRRYQIAITRHQRVVHLEWRGRHL